MIKIFILVFIICFFSFTLFLSVYETNKYVIFESFNIADNPIEILVTEHYLKKGARLIYRRNPIET